MNNTEITPEQKREIKAFIDNMSIVFTDTISKIWEELELSPPPTEVNYPPEPPEFYE